MRQSGPRSSDEIQRYLNDARVPVRIACNGVSGHPVLASLWFVPQDGKLWCANPPLCAGGGPRFHAAERERLRAGEVVAVELSGAGQDVTLSVAARMRCSLDTLAELAALAPNPA